MVFIFKLVFSRVSDRSSSHGFGDGMLYINYIKTECNYFVFELLNYSIQARTLSSDIFFDCEINPLNNIHKLFILNPNKPSK